MSIQKNTFGLFCIGMVVLLTASTAVFSAGEWRPYENRYALVVMARTGHQCYFGTCKRMYEVLTEDYGFKTEHVRFYATKSYREEHPDIVYGISLKENLRKAYQWAQSVCTDKDLFYVYWVDHGGTSSFSVIDGFMSHKDLGELMEPIQAKIVIGAYNPCQSGCLINDVSRTGVISITSTQCGTNNSFSWAENWWASIMKHPDGQQYVFRCPTTMKKTDIVADADGDGVVSMFEGYIWTARIGGAREGTALDANGDKAASHYHKDEIDADIDGSDAFIANHYSLSGWKAMGNSTTKIFVPSVKAAGYDFHLCSNRDAGGLITLTWRMVEAGHVTVNMYTVDGTRITRLLDNEYTGRGYHRKTMPFSFSGVYAVELIVGGNGCAPDRRILLSKSLTSSHHHQP